ncbi:MAG: MFS transporter [Propionibacterium sp.]
MEDPSLALIRRDRSFAWYWSGQSVSSFGSQVTVMALPLVTAVSLHGTPAQVGWVATATMLPYLLFSLIAGHFLEGCDARKVMLPANLVQAAAIAVIPIAWAAGWLSVPLLVVLAFIAGCAALCFGVVGFSYLPSLVTEDDLAPANRALQGSRTVAEVAGPGIAGILVGALGAPLAMAVDAASYLASALGIARSTPLTTPSMGRTGPAQRPAISEGLRILFANTYLRALTVHAALYNLAEQIFTLNLVLWAVQGQGLTPSRYGLAMGAAGIGGLIGTATALHLERVLGLGKAFAVSLLLSCGVPLLAVAGDLHGSALAAVLGGIMLLSGVGLGNANVYSLTMRQTAIPKDQLTRSAGAYTQVMYGSIPIGSALAGLLGQHYGTRTAVLAGAIGMLCSTLPMLSRKVLQLRHVHDVHDGGSSSGEQP